MVAKKKTLANEVKELYCEALATLEDESSPTFTIEKNITIKKIMLKFERKDYAIGDITLVGANTRREST